MARRPRRNSTEDRMVRSLDKLARYDEFNEKVAPILRKALEQGWTREKIDADPQIQAFLAARQITIALTDPDASKALAAIKDHRDRTQGKPTEKLEIENKYAKLKDEELDAQLLSLGLDEPDDDVAH